MSVSALLITANPGLQLEIREALALDSRIDFIAADASKALSSQIIETAADEFIMVIDAQVPKAANQPSDREEKAALWLLQELRAKGIRRPALVITSRPLGISEIDQYCCPDNNAIALPQRHLTATTLTRFVRMLCNRTNEGDQAWTVIEVEVKRNSAKCFIGDRAGKLIEWGSAASYSSAVQRLALVYAKPDFAVGWSLRFHTHGVMLFNELIIATLTPGLFSHLERAAGGLEKLAFRFRVDDASLYAAPFEATVRFSDQPPLGTATEFTQSPFVLLHAPITRKMHGITVRSSDSEARVPRPARLLFVRSQVTENPQGETSSAVVGVPEIDQTTGRTRIKQVEFCRLDNIELELAALQALQRSDLDLRLLDLSNDRDPRGAAAKLTEVLAGDHFDIVHFAGHSLTTKDSLTLLVLPGEQPGEAEGMPVQTFADAAAASGVRLVYFSSCQGSSANTVASLGQRGVPHVLGFRWDVEDDRAADFAAQFYSKLFRSKHTICGAFREACYGVYRPDRIEDSPIWASPILASRSDDWMAQRFS